MPITAVEALFPSHLGESSRNLSDPLHRIRDSRSRALHGNINNSETQHSSATAPQHAKDPRDRPPEPPADQVRVFIGIFSALNPVGMPAFTKYDYAARRNIARATWVQEARQYDHVTVRFVLGNYPTSSSTDGSSSSRKESGSAASVMSQQQQDSRGAGVGSEAPRAVGGGGASAVLRRWMSTGRPDLKQHQALMEEMEREGDFLQLDVEGEQRSACG